MKDADSGNRLWLWVVLAFVLLIGAWTTFIIIAAKNPVEEVPLENASGARH